MFAHHLFVSVQLDGVVGWLNMWLTDQGSGSWHDHGHVSQSQCQHWKYYGCSGWKTGLVPNECFIAERLQLHWRLAVVCCWIEQRERLAVKISIFKELMWCFPVARQWKKNKQTSFAAWWSRLCRYLFTQTVTYMELIRKKIPWMWGSAELST